MSVNLYVTLGKSQWADKSPYPVVVTDTISFTFNVTDVVEITSDANLSTVLYLDGVDDVGNSTLTGSTTLSGTTAIVSKTLGGNLSPGNEYILAVFATADGQLRLCGKIALRVALAGSNN